MAKLPTFLEKQHPLKLPETLKERALKWVQTQAATKHKRPLDAPFKRLVDIWFAGIAWAVHKEIPPVSVASGKKFVSLGPNQQDLANFAPWRAKLLTVVAIRDFGHEDDRVRDSNEIIDLANRYAEVGVNELVNQLEKQAELEVPRLHSVVEFFSDEVSEARSKLEPEPGA
jgi:hypothetical protein